MTESIEIKQVGLRKSIYDQIIVLKGELIQQTQRDQSISDTLAWILTTWMRPDYDGSH